MSQETIGYTFKRSYAILPPGLYPVEIDTVTAVEANNSLGTLQHATKYRSLDPERPGSITQYTNDIGYEHDPKDKKVVLYNTDGTPKISKANTKAGREIFGTIGACAGLEGSFNTGNHDADLKAMMKAMAGAKLAIRVGRDKESNKIKVVENLTTEEYHQELKIKGVTA